MIETKETQETGIPSLVSQAGAKSGNSSTEGEEALLISRDFAFLLYFVLLRVCSFEEYSK